MRKLNWEFAPRLTSYDELLIGMRVFGNVEDPYKDWIKLVYKVVDTSLPIYLFCGGGDIYEEEDGSTSIEYVFDMSNVSEVMIEKTKVLPSRQHTFDTVGNHTVYVKFTDMTSIPNNAFDSCTELVSFVLPESITTIGNDAFFNTSLLEEVSIPDTITTINDTAFHMSGIKKISIGSGVLSIGEDAFSSCDNLETITIKSSNPVYDSRSNCNAIMDTATNTLLCGCKNTTIPNTCLTIGEYAFSHCLNLTSINIPNSVINIGKGAFYFTNLTKVTIPDSVVTIEDYAFALCYYITELTIGLGVLTIGFEAFSRSSRLNKITSYAITAPELSEDGVFDEELSEGTLYVPEGATGYEERWMIDRYGYLGNWTKQIIQ